MFVSNFCCIWRCNHSRQSELNSRKTNLLVIYSVYKCNVQWWRYECCSFTTDSVMRFIHLFGLLHLFHSFSFLHNYAHEYCNANTEYEPIHKHLTQITLIFVFFWITFSLIILSSVFSLSWIRSLRIGVFLVSLNVCLFVLCCCWFFPLCTTSWEAITREQHHNNLPSCWTRWAIAL